MADKNVPWSHKWNKLVAGIGNKLYSWTDTVTSNSVTNEAVKGMEYVTRGAASVVGHDKSAVDERMEGRTVLVGKGKLSKEEELAQKAAEEAKTAERARNLAVQEQCFLYMNMQKVLSQCISKVGRGRVADPVFYATLSGNSALIYNKILHSKEFKHFLEIEPWVFSLLQPKIRLYKVAYSSPVDKKGTPVEFHFSNHFPDPKHKKNRYTGGDFESVYSDRKMRGDGAGLLSFKFTNEGQTKPVDKTLSAELKFVFQNAETFLRAGIAPGATLNSPSEAQTIAYSDLIMAPSSTAWSRGISASPATSGLSTERYFRILAEIGWTVPHKNINEKYIIDNNLRKAIADTKIRVALELHKHDLEFKENGAIELTVNYTGWIEGALKRGETDIFKMSQEYSTKLSKWKQDMAAAQSRLKKVQGTKRDHDSEVRKSNKTSGNKGTAPAASANQADNAKSKKLEGQIKGQQAHIASFHSFMRMEAQKERGKKYETFLQQLQNFGGIWRMKVPNSELQLSSEGLVARGGRKDKLPDSTAAELNKRAKAGDSDAKKTLAKKTATTPAMAGAWELERIVQQAGSKKAAAAKKAVQGASADVAKKVKTAANGMSKASIEQAGSEAIASSAPFLSDGKTVFHFVYLGDIINAALMTLANNNDAVGFHNSKTDTVNFILGPYTWTDPFTGTPYYVNLADIPISLHAFHIWFIDKVIRPLREEYPLKEFLQDIISDLVASSIGPLCIDATAGGQKSTARVHTAEIWADSSNIFRGKRYCVENVKFNYSSSRGWGRYSTHPSGKPPKNVPKLYYYLYASSFSPSVLTGDKQGDFERGVYHFHIGSPRGLLKNIKFKRNDQPFLRSHRIVNNVEPEMFREIYDADVELFGNPLFLPGQYIFINPSTFGDPKRARSASRRLGLGGYFLVTKVEHELKPGSYFTKLNCKWESFGAREGKRQRAPRSIGKTGCK